MVLFAPLDRHAGDPTADDDMVSPIVLSRPLTLQLEPQHLSALEQSVVALSLFDARSTASAPGFLSRVFSGLFGIEPPNRLASRRLEMLRCYSILVREAGGRPDACDAARLKGFGFSEAKIGEINRLVARACSAIPMKARQDRSDHHAA